MSVKGYLKQIKYLDIKINNKIAEKEELYTMATRISPTLSSDKPSGFQASDKVGNLVAKIVDNEKEISSMIADLYLIKSQIIHEIEQLDENYYSVLYKRYVQYKDFSIIANEMGYSYQYIVNLHGNALKSFGDKYHVL